MHRIPRSAPVAPNRDALGTQASTRGRQVLPAWRGPVRLLAPGALLATIVFSCNNKDAIWITPPGGLGGSAGSSGSAGAGGGGNGANGGDSGSGGNGGSSMAGAAGSSMGGAAGSGTAGSAGSGTGGSAGSGQAGTTSLPGDAGADAEVPDSAVQQQPLTQQQAADAICARLDDVASCPPPDPPQPDCSAGIIGGWEFFKSTYPNCATIVDDYFNCIALEPVTSFDCAGGTTPEASNPQPGNCAAQNDAFQPVQDGSAPCAQ